MRTKDFKTEDWLEWFCEFNHESKTVFRLPDGRRAATDGKILVITTQDGPTREQKREKIFKSVIEFSKKPPVDERVFSRQEAVNVFGKLDNPIKKSCPECSGKGKAMHYCDCQFCNVGEENCEYCEGSGVTYEYPEIRIVRINGKPFDANLVAYVIENCPPCEKMTFWLSSNERKGGNIVNILTDTWRAVIVGLAEDTDATNAPEVMTVGV